MNSKRSRHRGHGTIHGVVVVDKPSGPTSHDVVAAARRHFGTRRIGHAGTLDPLATGVLVLLLGEATKLSAYLTRSVKSYEAEVVFGSSTTSLDAQGTVTRRKSLEPGWLAPEALEQALANERKRRLQVPPAVSAIKVEGKPAHARTRRGEEFVLAPRDVELHRVEVLRWDDPRLLVELTVSKGYYVRAFARDLGETLGVPAHLGNLRRTRSGPFRLEDAHPFPPPTERPLLTLAEVARCAFTTAQLTEVGAEHARAGKALQGGEDYELFAQKPCRPAAGAPERPAGAETDPSGRTAPEPIACLRGDRLLALAEHLTHKTLKIVRGIHDPGEDGLHSPGPVG